MYFNCGKLSNKICYHMHLIIIQICLNSQNAQLIKQFHSITFQDLDDKVETSLL